MIKANIRRAILASAAIFLTGAAISVHAKPATAKRTAIVKKATVAKPAAAMGAPALWVARDADSTVYLFGTVHLLKKDIVWNTPVVQRAMAQSKELWLEALDVEDQAKLAPLVQKLGLDPARPLSTKLSKEQNAELDKLVAELGLPRAAIEPMQPWLAGLTLSVLPLQKAGWDPNSGVDKLLRAQAVKEGDTLKAFESAEQQMRFFGELSQERQVEFLNSAIDDAAKMLPMMDKIASAYARGDVDTIGNLLNADMKASAPELYDILLTRRNKAWAERIDTVMKGKGTHFVAVGAAHLAGSDSVQRQLAARGIAVTRVAR